MCMCGIVGCLALALEAEPDSSWVATATERISHRGPDDEGFYTDNDVALGYKRLAIIDLSQAGHQPMRSADGRYWMVFNGEIYNYVELGRELQEQGVVLRSSCDSEVLLETYARVGKDVVHRLRGMFAFAIWDSWTHELFCARDQFGIKPFYYRLDRVHGQPLSRAAGGGRHAAPEAHAGVGGHEPAREPDDWFTPGPRPRGPGRHAAGPDQDPGPTGRFPRSSPVAIPDLGAAPGRLGSPGGPGGRPGGTGGDTGGTGGDSNRAGDDGGGAGDDGGGAGRDRLLRFASERKALADPGELRG